MSRLCRLASKLEHLSENEFYETTAGIHRKEFMFMKELDNPECVIYKYQNSERALLLVKIYDWKFEPIAWLKSEIMFDSSHP